MITHESETVKPQLSRGLLGALLALAIAHLVLAIAYASVTPYRTSGVLLGQRDPATGQAQAAQDIGAPDERQHVNYVARLAQGQGFPVFNPSDPNLFETYQSHQPPLYYLLGTGWAKLTGIAGELQAEPTTGRNSTAGVLMRSLNALIGAANVCGVFFLAWWALRRADLSLISAGFAAFLPMNVALSGAVSNDPLLYALCTWTLALAVRGVRDGWTLRLAIGIGILTGLALITKTTAVALLPALLAATLIKQESKPRLSIVAIALVLAFGIATPWWLRNQSLYGDPLAIKAFGQAFTGNPTPETFIEPAVANGASRGTATLEYWANWVGWWTARSFFGVFGYMDIFLNERGTSSSGPRSPNLLYRLLLVGTLALLAAAWLRTRGAEWEESKSARAVIGLFALVVFLLFLRFNMQYFQGQARYLFPATGPVAIGISLGVAGLFSRRVQIAGGVILGGLLLLNLYALNRLPSEFDRRTDRVAEIVLPFVRFETGSRAS